MLDILHYIEKTNKSTSPDEAFLHLQKALGTLGLDLVIYSLMTDHPSINKKQGHGVLESYPEHWMKYYFEKNYQNVDPVRKYIMQTSGAFLWSDLPEIIGPMKKDESLLMNQAKEAKLFDGIGFSLHAPRNEILGMGFASSSGGVELHPDLLSQVTMLAAQFHNVFMNLHKQEKENYKTPYIALTDREKEVLYWCQKGKSNWVISEILKISENTVKFHFCNIYGKLSVNSRVTAVLKAIRLGLIIP